MIHHRDSSVIGNENILPGFYLLRLHSPTIASQCLPGQFVHLRCPGSGTYLRRPFSIYSSNGEDSIEIIYKVVGRATSAMSHLKAGDAVDLVGPLGKPFMLRKGKSKAIALGGGIGIPPVMFFCQYYGSVLDRTVLLIGAKTRRQVLLPTALFTQQIEIEVFTEDGSRGKMGTPDLALRQLLINKEFQREETLVIACGPRPFLYEVHRIASDFGVECQVSVEETIGCGVGACLACAVPSAGGGYLHICKDGAVVNSSQIDWERWLKALDFRHP